MRPGNNANGHPLLLWAAREIQRRPGHHMLLCTCLSSLVFLTASALLFSQALDTTWNQLMDQAPDLVIRRIDSGGWAPMPAERAVALTKSVPGALDPTPRIWGIVPGPEGPVTVVASTGIIPQLLLQGLDPPAPGQAVVGRGIADMLTDDHLVLENQTPVPLTIIGSFPAESGLATHDLVWIAPEDARQLLGLAAGQASDLAVHLFRDEEEQAIQADLAAVFPWPVHITGHSTSAWRHHTQSVRMGGIAVVACIPALLALLLIITGTAVGSNGMQAHWGLLKSLGWTTGDIVRLQVAKATIVGIPAVLAGLAAAYTVVFYPPAAGIAALWITGGQHLPALVLNNSGAVLIMLEIVALVCLPYIATVFLATLKGAAKDPWHLIQVDSWK